MLFAWSARRFVFVCEIRDTHYARYARRPWQWPLPLYELRTDVHSTRLSLCVLLMRRQDNRTNNKIVRDDRLRVSRVKTNIFFLFTIFMQCAYDNCKSKKFARIFHVNPSTNYKNDFFSTIFIIWHYSYFFFFSSY